MLPHQPAASAASRAAAVTGHAAPRSAASCCGVHLPVRAPVSAGAAKGALPRSAAVQPRPGALGRVARMLTTFYKQLRKEASDHASGAA